MNNFIKGLDLCEKFFNEVAIPVLNNFSGLKYTAGLLGYGSDVLGYDDVVSTDHMWGPRFYLFLNNDDIYLKDDILEAFSTSFPYEYMGYCVNFSTPNQDDNGVRHPELITTGKVSPLVWIQTIDEFVNEYLGRYPQTGIDWISLSEHRLLGFTSGRIFCDMLDIETIRKKLEYYPHDVTLYLIASQWSLISEEQAFVKRCGECGDELGSRIVCTRIVERLMRLCFLYKNTYAPYSKWFGKSFDSLDIPGQIKTALSLALSAEGLLERENALIDAQMQIAELHNKSGLTDKFEINVRTYYGRDIKVLFVDDLAAMVWDKIDDTDLKHVPMIGSFSQIGNYVVFSDNPAYSQKIADLYSNIGSGSGSSSGGGE